MNVTYEQAIIYAQELKQEIIERKRVEQVLKQRAAQLDLINGIGQQIAAVLDLDSVLDQAAALIQQAFDYHLVALFLVVEDTIHLKAMAGPYQASVPPDHSQDLNEGIIGWVAAHGEKMVVNDIGQEARFAISNGHIRGTQAELCLPIKVADQIRGILDIQSPHRNAFGENDEIAMEIVADQIAVALENARLYTEIERRARQLVILHELDQAITTNLQQRAVYHAFAQHATRLFRYDRMALTLVQQDTIVITYATGDAETELPVGTRLPADTSATGWVINRRQPLLRHNIATGYHFFEDEHLVAYGIQSAMVMPLRIKGQAIGTWNLSSRQIGTYHPDDLQLAQAMADQLAIAIENARLFEEVQSRREQLRQLTQQIITAQEEERQRLSRELHDEAGQSLTALKIGLEIIHADLPPDNEALCQGIAEAVSLSDQTMERLRLLARDLRPPALDMAGLDPTLEGLCRDFGRRTKLSIEYVSEAMRTLSDTANICLYRLLQEALTNVAKHAQANHIWVSLSQKIDTICLTVEDDGQGFEHEVGTALTMSRGIGLIGIRERLELLGGCLEIKSEPGQGTRLEAMIPTERT